MVSFAEIDHLLDQANQNTCETAEEVVELDTDSEDDGSHHEDQEMKEPVKEPVKEQTRPLAQVHVEVNANEQVVNIENDTETDQNDVTVAKNDANKENVRPQSTPIAKSDAPADTPKAIASIASTSTAAILSSPNASNESINPKLTVASIVPNSPAPEVEPALVKKDDNNPQESGPLDGNVPQKMYLCPFCDDDEVFAKKSALVAHLKSTHHKKLVKKTEKAGKLVRVSSSKRKYVAAEDDDDQSEDDKPQKIHVWSNPMSLAVKRYKKNATKFIYKKD